MQIIFTVVYINMCQASFYLVELTPLAQLFFLMPILPIMCA